MYSLLSKSDIAKLTNIIKKLPLSLLDLHAILIKSCLFICSVTHNFDKTPAFFAALLVTFTKPQLFRRRYLLPSQSPGFFASVTYNFHKIPAYLPALPASFIKA